MASFRCFNNSDVIATLIMTNFHLYLIQLWWQFFQMFVYGNVVYAQTWQVLTLKNCIEPLSYASTAYVVASHGPCFFDCFVKIWGTCKNFLGKWFTAPHPEKNCPYTYVCLHQLVLIIVDDICVARSVKILLREFQEETSNKPKKKTM